MIEFNLGFIRSAVPTAPNQKAAKERSGTRNLPKRSTSSVGKSSTSGMGMRSVSVGTLNQAVINPQLLIQFLKSFN